MSNLNLIPMYKVSVLTDGLLSTRLQNECSSYSDAVEKFLFYVHLALEDGLSVRCVNIIKGRKSIKMFVNHG